MTNSDPKLIGLGTMSAAFTLNSADNGFDVAVCNRKAQVTQDFFNNPGDLAHIAYPNKTLGVLVAAVAKTRAIILMVPAGQVVND